MHTAKLTVDDLKKWAKKNKPIAEAVLVAKAFADVERERVDAYIRPVFERYDFRYDMTGQPERRIENPKCIYLSEDDKLVEKYFAECDRVHRENGFDGPEGHCPALIAEDLLRKAENILLDELAKLMDVDGFHSLELRKRALDLALGACLKA